MLCYLQTNIRIFTLQLLIFEDRIIQTYDIFFFPFVDQGYPTGSLFSEHQ